MPSRIRRVIGVVVSAAVVLAIVEGFAANARSAGDAPSACNLSGYKALPGLTASATEDGATLVWDGDAGSELRLQLGVRAGSPSIRELAIRRRGAAWATVAANVTPEFRVVSGLRRLTNQQLDPLAGLDVPITPAVLEREKWEAFWDAPLNVPGGDAEHNDVTPPQHGVLDQPGLPRSPDEIKRATAIYHVDRCDVTTNGARIEVSFPGVTLGVFSGRLQFTVYRGTNLIRQEIIATTNEPSVAYKYDAGLKGLAISSSSRILWRGITNLWQDYHLGSAADDAPVTLKTSNRIVVAEGPSGSIAAFPPPHTFFWARETSYNLGYDWYRKDDGTTFSFGVRQAESEEPPEEEGRGTEDRHQNFALLSARPGTSQRMPIYLYVNPGDGPATMDAAWAFTRDDHFKAVPGFQVMATHFHMSLLSRARHFGGLDARVPDLEVLKAAGVTIVAPIDGGGGFVAGQSGGDPAYNGDDPKWLQWSRGLGAPPEYIVGSGVTPPPSGRGRAGGGTGGGAGRGGVDPYKAQADYFDVATRQSDSHFVVMPNSEMIRGDVTRDLGGHSDVFVSHRVFWTQGRKPGQPLVEDDPTYGRVYHVGSTADMMEMAHRENMLLFMPHPRTKGSAGYPDAIKDGAPFSRSELPRRGIPLGHGPRRIGDAPLRVPLPVALRRHEQLGRRRGHAAEVPAGDLRDVPAGLRRRHLRQQPGELRQDCRAAPARRMDAHRRRDEDRRVFRHVGRSADSELRRARHRQCAHDRRRRRVDVSARIRGSRVGRRAEDRSTNHPCYRSAAVRPAPLRDSVRRDGQEVGAIRRLGFGGQRRVRDADQDSLELGQQIVDVRANL